MAKLRISRAQWVAHVNAQLLADPENTSGIQIRVHPDDGRSQGDYASQATDSAAAPLVKRAKDRVNAQFEVDE